MEDRIAANDRYADLNSSDMRFLSAVGKGVLGDDCLIDCSQIPMIYCNYDTQDVVDITLDDLQVGDEIILAIRSSEITRKKKIQNLTQKQSQRRNQRRIMQHDYHEKFHP